MKCKALAIGLNNTFWDLNIWNDTDLSCEDIANKAFLEAIDCINELKESYTLIIAETCKTEFIQKLDPGHDLNQFEYLDENVLTNYIKEKLSHISLDVSFDHVFCKRYDCLPNKKPILHLLNKGFGYWNHELTFIDSNTKLLKSIDTMYVDTVKIDPKTGITRKDISHLL